LEVLEHIRDDRAIINNIKKETDMIFTLPTFNDPAHIRIFRKLSDIKKRYSHDIDINKIVRIDKWFVCWGKVVKKYSLKIWEHLL